MKTQTNGHTNGHRPIPVMGIQFTLDGTPVIPVRDDDRADRGAALLDELDDRLTELDAALSDQAAVLQLLADADRRVSMARERCRAVHAAIGVETSRREVTA